MKNDYEVRNPLKFINNQLNKNILAYSDIIELLITNCVVSFKKSKMRLCSDYLNFLNRLNLLCFKLDELLSCNRTNLYYCMLHILKYRYTDDLLFPVHYYNYNNSKKLENEIINFLNSFISRSLRIINQCYYICVPKFEYNNSKAFFTNTSVPNEKSDIVELLLKHLNANQKIFLFYLGSRTTYSNKYILTDQDIKGIEDIVNIFKKDKNIIVYPQQITNDVMQLIEKNVKGVQDYCRMKKLKINSFIYNPQNETIAKKAFLEFTITYKNFDYKFVLRKSNISFSWNVKKRNGKTYRINLYLEDDYKHIIQAMLNDEV